MMISGKGFILAVYFLLSIRLDVNAYFVVGMRRFVTTAVIIVFETTGIDKSLFSNVQSSVAHAKVDSEPLEISKLSKASYRGHVKFEIVGLKKLIREAHWAEILKEIDYYKPLFTPLVFANELGSPESSTAEDVRKQLESDFKELATLASNSGQLGLGIDKENVEKALDVYFKIENSFGALIRCYGSTAAPF